jgi:hypothetical protein
MAAGSSLQHVLTSTPAASSVRKMRRTYAVRGKRLPKCIALREGRRKGTYSARRTLETRREEAPAQRCSMRAGASTVAAHPLMPDPTAVFTKRFASRVEAGGRPSRPSTKQIALPEAAECLAVC